MAPKVVGSNLSPPKSHLSNSDLLKLSVLDDTTNTDLSDLLEGLGSGSKTVNNVPSNYNDAAHAAALSSDTPEDHVSNFKTILAEKSDAGVSSIEDQILNAAKETNRDENVKAAVDVLSDPSIPLEPKRGFVGAINDKLSALYEPANMLSLKALSEPSEALDSHAADETRFDLSKVIQRVHEENKALQKVHNMVAAQYHPSLGSKISDFVLNLIPGSTTVHTAALKAKLTGENPFISLVKSIWNRGDVKRDIRNRLLSMSPNEIREEGSKLIDIINEHPEYVTAAADKGDWVRDLNDIVNPDGYSNKKQQTDTILNWLDVLSVIPIGKVMKAGTKGVEALKGVRTAEEATDVGEQVAKTTSKINVSKEVPNPNDTNVVRGVAPVAKGEGAPYVKPRNITGSLFYDSSKGVPYRKLNKNALSSAIRDALHSDVQPTSVYKNLENTNPRMARNSFDTIVNDDTGEAAKAIAGTSRADVVGSAMLPEVEHVDGSVKNKLSYPDAVQQTRDAVPAKVWDQLNHDGKTHFDQREKAAIRAWKVNDFQDAFGMVPHPEMFQLLPDTMEVVDRPWGFSWRSVHGPLDHGYTDADRALKLAEFATRNVGIPEKDIGLIRRVGDKYVPTTLEEVNALKDTPDFQHDFYVTIDHDYRFKLSDAKQANKAAKEETGMSIWRKLKAKRNFLDTYAISNGNQGLLLNWLFDNGSRLHSTIYRAGITKADVASRIEHLLTEPIGDAAKAFKRLPTEKQDAALAEIYMANAERRDYDFLSLAEKGFNDEDMDFFYKFKKAADSDWYLKNSIYSDHLDRLGYREWVDSASDSRLAAKPLSKGSVPKGAKVWDPSTDSIRTLVPEEIDDLYKNGSGVAELWKPLDVDDDVATHVLHGNNPEGSYLRKFTENSHVLNYIPGYFPTYHKNPFFIVEKVNGGAENAAKGGYDISIRKANSSEEAGLIKDQLQDTHKDREFYWRPAKEITNSLGDTSDLEVDLSMGMGAFKRRGKLLADATSTTGDLNKIGVENPLESLVKSSRRLSKKIAMDEYLDTVTTRAAEYGSDYLPTDPRTGQKVIPEDIRQVKYRGGRDYDRSDLGDMVTTSAFINQLRHGYVNYLDHGVKQTFQFLGDQLANIGLPVGQRASYALSKKSLTRGARYAVFESTIGMNPARQILIQGQQAALLAAVNPKWMASSKAFTQSMYMWLKEIPLEKLPPNFEKTVEELGVKGFGSKEAAHLAHDQFKRAGIFESVDHNTFIASATNDMATDMLKNFKRGTLSYPGKGIRYLNKFSRRVGFDAGETFANTMSWLAHRDRALNKGLDVADDAVIDDITANSRIFNGAMNLTGELPTNKNTMSMIFQFTQNQQKLLLNAWTNRSIEPAIRNRLKVLSLILYGVPGMSIYEKFFHGVENQQARDALEDGLIGFMVNKALSLASGDNVRVDTSSLSPYDIRGPMELVTELATQPWGEVVANSPSMSMLFGSNPRVTRAAKEMAKYFHLQNDYGSARDFLDVAEATCKIFSGCSNAFKAYYILEANKLISSSGNITDDDISRGYALPMLFGFEPKEVPDRWSVIQQVNKANDALESDVTEWYKQAKLHYLSDRLDNNQTAFMQHVLNEFWRTPYGQSRKAREMLGTLLRRDQENGDMSLTNLIIKSSQIYPEGGDVQRLIDKTPFKDPTLKTELKDLVHYTYKWKAKDYDEDEKK